jgi:hypothetical protein
MKGLYLVQAEGKFGPVLFDQTIVKQREAVG